MKELLKAIVDRFACSDDLVAMFPDGIFNENAWDREALPAACFVMLGANVDYSTKDASGDAPYNEVVSIQFSVYCDDDAFGFTAHEAIDHAFNHTSFFTADDLVIDARRIRGVISTGIDERGWNVNADYQFTVSRLVDAYLADECN